MIESLIRAIEARTPADPKLPDKDRLAMVNRDEAEGFVLTNYFYDQLKVFEKDTTGLKDSFPDWLHNLDVDKIRKQASEIQFASHAAPDVMLTANQKAESENRPGRTSVGGWESCWCSPIGSRGAGS